MQVIEAKAKTAFNPNVWTGKSRKDSLLTMNFSETQQEHFSNVL